MKKYPIPVMCCATLALAVSLGVDRTAAASDRGQATSVSGPVTVEGCLMREEDVPGRKPNLAEKLGVGNDYILAFTKIVKGTRPAAAARTGETAATSGMSGAMYDINGIDEETLKRHLNQRVAIDGAFDNVDAAMKSDALIEIRATAIRLAKGDCKR